MHRSKTFRRACRYVYKYNIQRLIKNADSKKRTINREKTNNGSAGNFTMSQ